LKICNRLKNRPQNAVFSETLSAGTEGLILDPETRTWVEWPFTDFNDQAVAGADPETAELKYTGDVVR
jgi:hypothetical protein